MTLQAYGLNFGQPPSTSLLYECKLCLHISSDSPVFLLGVHIRQIQGILYKKYDNYHLSKSANV